MKRIVIVAAILSLAFPSALTFATTELNAVADPPTATLATSLTLTLTLDGDASESAECKVVFPNDMRVPEQIGDGIVTVNGLPAKDIKIEEKTVTFEIPEPQEDRKVINIVFPIPAGLKNPFRAGNYHIQASVGDQVAQGELEVSKMLQEAPKVSVVPDKVGRTIGVTIQILHPKELVITKDDTLNVEFPPEFLFPETFEPDDVLLCSQVPPAISTHNNLVSMIFPKDINPEEPVVIIFSAGFGIKSPLWPGNFQLTLGIPGKMEDTKSETFQIFALSPTLTLAVDPPIPESGWFSSVPTIQIASSAKREIFFSWDSGARTRYEEPITPESGIHVLSYVGKVENGGWESELFETFRIDLDEPVFDQIRSSINTEEFTLQYTVKDTSQCVSGIGDLEAKPVGFNRFEVDLKLEPGANDFVFWAQDVVGRHVEFTHQIIVDKTPPALTITSPSPATVVCGKEIIVSGKTEPDSQVRINGNTVVPNSKGDFIGVVKPNEEGPQDISVEAVDPAGNVNYKSVSILYIRSTRIVMTVGSRQVTVAGKNKEIEVAPYEKFGVIYIPIPAVSGWLGYKISTKDKKTWLLEDKQGTKISFGIGSNVVNIESKQGSYSRTLENNPEMTDGTLCVPVEFVDRGLGLETMIDTNTVTVLFCPR
jgi:hypothetical protein